jgi:hypothetical protein
MYQNIKGKQDLLKHDIEDDGVLGLSFWAESANNNITFTQTGSESQLFF